MSAQTAGRAIANAAKSAGKQADGHVLNKGAKKDPELYVRSPMPLYSTRISFRLSRTSMMSNFGDWWLTFLACRFF